MLDILLFKKWPIMSLIFISMLLIILGFSSVVQSKNLADKTETKEDISQISKMQIRIEKKLGTSSKFETGSYNLDNASKLEEVFYAPLVAEPSTLKNDLN